MKKTVILISVVLCLILLATTAFAAKPVDVSRGQLVFVGAGYNDLSYMRDGQFINQFTSTKLIIRNIDLERPITLLSVGFHDPNGNLVKEYLDNPIVIDPLTMAGFLATFPVLGIPHYEKDGGHPCFLVKWKANKLVNEPIIGASISMVRLDGDFIEYLASSSIQGVVLREKNKR